MRPVIVGDRDGMVRKGHFEPDGAAPFGWCRNCWGGRRGRRVGDKIAEGAVGNVERVIEAVDDVGVVG